MWAHVPTDGGKGALARVRTLWRGVGEPPRHLSAASLYMEHMVSSRHSCSGWCLPHHRAASILS